MDELAHLGAALAVKQVSSDQRIITGLAACTGNLDRVGDVIEGGAFRKTLSEKRPSDVAVFIGHRQDTLPVGIPLRIDEQAGGLLTETYIFPGPQGDQILETAKALLAHNQTLGLSIGYRARGSKFARVDGKTVRVLTDVDLIEYSFAARQSIANPQALVTGVKQTDPDATEDASEGVYTVQAQGDGWAVSRGDGSVVAVYPSADLAEAVRTALVTEAARDAVEDAAEMLADMAGGKAGGADEVAVKVEWGTALVNTFPDANFMFIESGGTKDDEGKTVPRSLRHFPIRDAEGQLDAAHLRDAIGRIPQSTAPGLTAQRKTELQAKARRLLEGATSGKTLDAAAPEWESGAALQVFNISCDLRETADAIADQLSAMARLGEDTKAGARMKGPMRAKLRECMKAIGDILDWAEMADAGTMDAGKLAVVRHELDLLALTA